MVKVFIFTHFPKGQGTEGTGLPDPWPGAWKNWQDPLAILQAEIKRKTYVLLESTHYMDNSWVTFETTA